MKSSRLMRFIWLAGGLAIVLGLARGPVLHMLGRGKLLAPVEGARVAAWFAGEFRADGAYPTTVPGLLPPRVPTIGSWIDGDEWQGHAETAWFAASRPLIRVCVAGYPQTAGCKLRAEFRDPAGAITSIECPLPNPCESWNSWEIHRPAGATALRIVAEDRSSAITGWVAFSHPFETIPAVVTAAYLHAQIWTTLALALVLIWGPGLICADRLARLGRVGTGQSLLSRAGLPDAEMRAPILIGTGPLALAAAGILIWAAGGWIAPQKLGLALSTIAWVAIGVALWRRKFELKMSESFRRVLAVTALVLVAVVAKSFHSVGPAGELFRGSVSRNFEMSDRIDSRYSFYVVQVAAHHFGPAAPETDKFFFPWTFFSRGPLAGLAAIPVVLATGGEPPLTMPDNRWSPFDHIPASPRIASR
jgi:hypothetical protein